jgi:hypothetical protein
MPQRKNAHSSFEGARSCDPGRVRIRIVLVVPGITSRHADRAYPQGRITDERRSLTRELQMKLRDPRLQVAAQVMLLVAFAFWLGGLDAKPARDTHYWIMTVLCAAGIGCSAYLLLRKVWGSSS